MSIMPRSSLLVSALSLILMALLLACGTDEPTERPDHDRATSLPTSTLAPATAEATPTAASPTPVPPTTEPTPMPTPVPPTTEPTPMPTPVPPTTEPTPTSTPASPTPAPTQAIRPTAGPPLAQTSPETDQEALIALYNATNSASWDENDDWLTGAPLEEWYGVSTDGNGRVTAMAESYRCPSTGTS